MEYKESPPRPPEGGSEKNKKFMKMELLLKEKLLEYLEDNNPDTLFSLQSEGNLDSYLQQKTDSVKSLIQHLEAEGKPAYIIESSCMDEMTESLRPSKFNYIMDILDEEFIAEYVLLQSTGTLVYEVINMVAFCKYIFEELDFNEDTEYSRVLHYAITGMVHEYFNDRISVKGNEKS